MQALRGKVEKWTKGIALGFDQRVGPQIGVRPKNDPKLCSLCSNITFDKLCDSYTHYPDYWALKQSAVSCPLCHVLLSSLQTEDEFPAIKEDELQSSDTGISLEGFRLKDGDGWEDTLYLKCGNRIKIVDFLVDEANTNETLKKGFSDAADSEENFASLRDILSTCIATHKGCTLGDTTAKPLADPPQRLPTRVLDVGLPDSTDPIKLVETGRRPDKYVALSHCWGKEQIITTKKANIEEHKKGIDFQELSKTFQDSVTVTRKLGMRYLWIDSLCIIQDESDDWAKESAYMGDIYRTATFSIMAAGAEAGAIGCFIPRTAPPVPPVEIQYLSSSGKLDKLYIGLPRGSLHTGLEDGPLQSRAWCLQERVLSRRTIHFCKEHIVYECQMASIAENGTSLDGASGMEVYQIKLHDSLGTSSHLKNPIHGRWRRIVQDYSRRDLTKGTDKLPAISGLAQKIHEETGDQYAAGLWKGHLHNDLFFLATDHMEPVSPYRAPSWSWAAYDVPISYEEVFDMKTIYYDSSLKDVEAVTNPTTINPFGSIDSGQLKFFGRIRPALYSEEPPPKDTLVTKNAKKIYNEDRSLDHLSVWLGFGALDAACDGERLVLCLSIGVKPMAPAPFHMVLLVEPTRKAAREYRRVGAAFIRPKDWFDHCTYEEFTLV